MSLAESLADGRGPVANTGRRAYLGGVDFTALLEDMGDLWPLMAVVVVGIAALTLARWLLLGRKRLRQNEPRFLRHAIMLALTVLLVVAVVLALPLDGNAKAQLLTLLGVLLSAIIALSSTTFIGNAMAGLMIRAVQSFRPGDFLTVEEHFGRVTEVGFLHTEIQTEYSELTTLPNLFLVTHPVTVTRHTGTFVHAEVSLSYGEPHWRIDELLRHAVAQAEMHDPFVQIVELGDFSITYRVAGFLENVKHLLSARTRLRACVLDTLHSAGVEIVSPTFVNQRRPSEEVRVVPRGNTPAPAAPEVSPEATIFDKAERAESRARLEQEVVDLQERLGELKLGGGDDLSAARLDRERARTERRLAHLRALLQEAEAS